MRLETTYAYLALVFSEEMQKFTKRERGYDVRASVIQPSRCRSNVGDILQSNALDMIAFVSCRTSIKT